MRRSLLSVICHHLLDINLSFKPDKRQSRNAMEPQSLQSIEQILVNLIE